MNMFIHNLMAKLQRVPVLDRYNPHWLARLREIHTSLTTPHRWHRKQMRPQKNNRTPRGLIDAVGHSFKFLFGTATQDQVKDIQNLVQTFAQRQSRMINMVQQFTTVLNHTYDEINTNRHEINMLITSLHNLTSPSNTAMAWQQRRLWIREHRTDIETTLYELDTIAHKYV